MAFGIFKGVPGTWYQIIFTYIWNDIFLFLFGSACGTFNEIVSSPPKPKLENLEKRSEQVAVITGGPRGVARGLIKRLLQLDYTIIMGVRNVQYSEKRLAAFAEKNPELCFSKVKLYSFDLMSLHSVRDFATKILENFERVDLLLCNAAVMSTPYELTIDGLESQFQANYLSNFLLTQLLLERLASTSAQTGKPAHVIYTSSFFYKQGKFLGEEIAKPLVYSPYKFYYASKLYGVMSTAYLQQLMDRQGKNVKFFAVHPGNIPTDLWYSGMGSLVGWLANKMKFMFRSIENGADTILWPVLCRSVAHTGGFYMESGHPVVISRVASNAAIQSVLYEKSLELAGLSVSGIV